MTLLAWGRGTRHAQQLTKQLLKPTPFSWVEWKQDQLPQSKEGDVILALGTRTLITLQTAGVAPKNRVLRSLHGKPLPWIGRTVIPTYSPESIWIDWANESNLRCDFGLAQRLVTYSANHPLDYKFADNFNEEVLFLKQELSKDQAPYVTLDLETLGLDPYAENAWIVSVQITVQPGKARVIRFTENDPRRPAMRTSVRGNSWQILNQQLHNQIQWMLSNPGIKVNGANLKFDRTWMYHHWGIFCTNQVFDTTLVGSLINENRSNSLNQHAKEYTILGGYDDTLNEKYNKGRMDEIPDEDFLPYAAGDTDAAHRVMLALKPKLLLQGARSVRHYTRLVMPAATAFEKMERTGIVLDQDYVTTLSKDLEARLGEITRDGLRLIGGILRARHRNAPDLTRSALIKDYLFGPRGLKLKPLEVTEKTGQAATHMHHLNMFAEHPKAGPFIELLQEFKDVQKILSTFVIGFTKHLRQDGRLHPTAMMFKGAFEGTNDISGANTGRLSFKDPAIQTLPKHKKIAKRLRRMYVAPPGYLCANLDFSQGELRIAACLADEPNMIRAYQQGIDLHALTGGMLNGFDRVRLAKLEKENSKRYSAIRQGGKAGNFGLLYGMKPAGFVNYAEKTFGVQLTLEQSEDQCRKFFELYPKIHLWHLRQQAQAQRHKQVHSPLGRIRHLPLVDSPDNQVRSKALRQAINSPVQSALSDMTMLALVTFNTRYSKDTPNWPEECQPVMMTHDAITCYVAEATAHIWISRIKECMESLPLSSLGWQPQLAFPVDCEVGPNLAEMEEYQCA